MLNILEKVQYIVSGLVILGSVGLYLWQGTETKGPDQIPPLKLIKTNRPAAPPRSGAKALPPAPTAAEDRALLDRLVREQNVKASSVERKNYEVDQETFRFVSREANWEPELNKAASELLKGADGHSTRIQINKIDENSLFKKFGFEDNDIIEFIDGEKIDFEGSSMVDHVQRWKRLKDKIQKGGKVALTITRNGQPVQIEFKLGL